MDITPLTISGAFLIRFHPREDARGYFMRTWDREHFAAAGLVTEWVQENQSYSAEPYTLRGLHFQRAPHAETKLVRCTQGALWDVIADIRPDSPTYGSWQAVTLSSSEPSMLYIPKGCAHGFLSLEPHSIITYKVDAAYAPSFEAGIRYNDPALAVEWPVPSGITPVLSDKDKAWPDWQR